MPFDPTKLVTADERADKGRKDVQGQIDRERDQRMSAGLPFENNVYQFDAYSRENILGAASMAHIAITLDDAQPGNFLWHGGTDPFVFIAADNTPVQMDAYTMLRLGQTAGLWKSAHIFAARLLKEAKPIPKDWRNDTHWPVGG